MLLIRSRQAARFVNLARSHTGHFRRTMASSVPHVAVLYQAVEPPVINGVKKPMKPGGYKDSAADIAYCLSLSPTVQAVTPTPPPSDRDPAHDASWCFPDTEAGILSALERGASHLWANTILFASHPLQTSARLAPHIRDVRVVGQPPRLVELYDDKELVNDLLRRDPQGRFTMPRAWSVEQPPPSSSSSSSPSSAAAAAESDLSSHLSALDLPFPCVAKPIRGRGSHGVAVCRDLPHLASHAAKLLAESPRFMIEEFLGGEEATVTVMPPSSSSENGDYWAMPVVRRFNHQDGVAPYNGVVAVTANSEAVTGARAAGDPAYARVMRECEEVARLLGATAPIRVDVRRRREDGGDFVLFDVNMKPNMTGPGRPGRDDQASLTLLAAEALGWNYTRLLEETLKAAATLEEVRDRGPREE